MYQKFIDACSAGNLGEVQKLYDECSETKRQEMLASINYAAFRWAARNEHLEVVKLLWEKCQEDKRQKMLASESCHVFYCMDISRSKDMLIVDWLLSVADENTRTTIYSELRNPEFALKLVFQREEIIKKEPELDIDKFNSQFTHFCKNKTLSMMMLTCKNLPEGLGNPLQIMEIFAETANFVAGRNNFDLQISEPIKAAQEILQCKTRNAVNSPEFFLAARKVKFDLRDFGDNADSYIHSGEGCSIL